jgi:hypothetical protein
LENSSSNQRCYQISLDSKESPEISALLQTSTTTQQSLFLCPSGSDGVKPPLIQIRKHQYRSFVISWLPNGWPADAIEFPISVLLTVSAFDAMKLKHNRTADEMPPLITATEYTAGMQSEMNRPLRKRVLVGKQRGLDTVNVPATMPSRVPVADDTFRIRRTLAILLMMLFIVLIYNYHSKYTL